MEELDEHNAIFAVLDGHGGENGELAARVAADAIKSHLLAHFPRLRIEPEAVFVAAFEAAHKAVLAAVLKARPPRVTATRTRTRVAATHALHAPPRKRNT